MADLIVDEIAYAEIANGLVTRLVRALIRQLLDAGLIDRNGPLSEDDIQLVSLLAFDVLLQFEDFKGHQQGNTRYPAVAGFAKFPAESMTVPSETDVVIISWRRADLHGSVTDAMVIDAFEELKME